MLTNIATPHFGLHADALRHLPLRHRVIFLAKLPQFWCLGYFINSVTNTDTVV